MRLPVIQLFLFFSIASFAGDKLDLPTIEISLKVISFDSKFIKAETVRHKIIKLPRNAIDTVIATNEFKLYELPLSDWAAVDGNTKPQK